MTPLRILALQARPRAASPPPRTPGPRARPAAAASWLLAATSLPPAAQRFAKLSECTHTLNFDRCSAYRTSSRALGPFHGQSRTHSQPYGTIKGTVSSPSSTPPRASEQRSDPPHSCCRTQYSAPALGKTWSGRQGRAARSGTFLHQGLRAAPGAPARLLPRPQRAAAAFVAFELRRSSWATSASLVPFFFLFYTLLWTPKPRSPLKNGNKGRP